MPDRPCLAPCLECSAGVHQTSHVLLDLFTVTIPLNIMTKNQAMRRNCGDNSCHFNYGYCNSQSNFKRWHASMYNTSRKFAIKSTSIHKKLWHVVGILARLKQTPVMDRCFVCMNDMNQEATCFNVSCYVLHPAAAAPLQAMLGTYKHSQNQHSMQGHLSEHCYTWHIQYPHTA